MRALSRLRSGVGPPEAPLRLPSPLAAEEGERPLSADCGALTGMRRNDLLGGDWPSVERVCRLVLDERVEDV